MAQHEEPMDIDSSGCDFDNKENAFHHSNVLPRTPCTEKGYEELDVSDLNMKSRYSTTPSLSLMSKSYTANCIDNKSIDSVNNIVDNEGNLTRSLNSAVTKNDSVVRHQMCLPLHTIAAELGHTDTNRSALRPLDSTVTLDNNVVIAVSTPNEIDENLSLPSSSSSIVHTPEATTPNKEELKDGGSPIMRGLKSVINMFRPSQSPIPLAEGEIVPFKTETLTPPIVLSPEDTAEKSQAVFVSTPLSSKKSKDALIERNSLNRDSLVFNEDLEKELQWKDETTIIFSKEKIPIHKLFYQTGKLFETKADNEKLDNTVEYMDISYNNSTLEVHPKNLPGNKNDAAASESDCEFVDCESTFTKNESQGDLSFKSPKTRVSSSDSNNVLSFDGNVPICGPKLNDIRETMNISTTSVKSSVESIVSTEIVKDSTTGKNTQTINNDKLNEGVSSVEIKNVESSCQVYSTQSSLPGHFDFKQAVPDGVSNINVILDQNNTFNIDKTIKKDCVHSDAQVDCSTENNIAIVTNRNENVLNAIAGISTLSQIPLISDPRVLLFNVSSEDIPNIESVYLENTVAEEKTIIVGEHTTAADIPLPDDDEFRKESLEDVINNKCGETQLQSQGEINNCVEIKIPMSNESASRFDVEEETLHVKKQSCNKVEQDILDKIQVSNEVANVIESVIESAITAVEQIVDDTENQDVEYININENINVAHMCPDLNETNIILNAIENVAKEIASIPQRGVIPINTETTEVETSDIVEELQKTIEKLEGKGKSSTLDETRAQTSFVTMNESKNVTNKVEDNSQKKQDNFISVVPDVLTSGEFKFTNSAEFQSNFTKNLSPLVSLAKFDVATELIIDNEEQISLGEEIEFGDNVTHQMLKTNNFVEGIESNILVENPDYITQSVAFSVCVTDDAAMKCNDHGEVDIGTIYNDKNLSVNEEIITPTEVTTDMSKQIPDPGVSILSCVVTTAPITNVGEIETENIAICVTDDAAMKCNDLVEVDIGTIYKDNNLTVNEEIVTLAKVTTDMPKQIPDPDVSNLSCVVTTAPITNVGEIKTDNIAVCITDDAAMKCNDLVEVDIGTIYKDNNLTANEEIVTLTEVTTDMSKEIPDPDINILSCVVTTAPITNVREIKTENVAISEQYNLNNEGCVTETLGKYQNKNEESVPDDKLPDSLSANLKADYDDALDEEIVASANNSPFVSVSANFEEISEDKPVELFENVDVPVETNEEMKISHPSSPKIVSKGYNFNFDDEENPFATRAKIRMSPPLGVTPNQSFDQTNETDIGKRLSLKKDLNREKRKSHPLRKKPSTTNKKLNTTFSGSSKDSTEKWFAKPKSMGNKMNEKEIEPRNTNLQPTMESVEVIGSLCVSKNTSTELKDLGVSNKALVNKVEVEVSTDVNSTEEALNAEKDCVIEIPVESLEQIEVKPSADSATSVAEESKNALSSEQFAYYSACTSSSDGLQSKSSYNIPEINNTNFSPFATKSKVRQSPPPSLDNSFATKSKLKSSLDSSCLITKDTYIDGCIKKSPRDEEKDSSDSLNNVTCSSKNTDKVNTEDEDTIEGPFLEGEDLVVDSNIYEREAEILINNKKVIDISGGNHDDMMQFSDLPTTDEGVADAGELFIDADAFEFLLNQNLNNAVDDNGKESLFLKFDPLFARRVSTDGVIAARKNLQKRYSTPQKTAPTQSDTTFNAKSPAPEPSSLNATNELDAHDATEESIDDLNITIAKPMMVVNPAVNPVVTPRTKATTPVASSRRSLTFTSPAIAVIDRLLSLSANTSAFAHETTIPEASRDQNEADHALTQLRELLADKEINVYTLRSEAKELKNRLSNMDSEIKALETMSEERLKNINELTEKLNEKTKQNNSMAKVVEEYEKTIASMIAEIEQDKKKHADERMQLIRERDEQTTHLASMEVSFSDLHSKYEKSKQIILAFKTNEEVYKKSVKELENNLSKMQNNYELLKQHATSKLNYSNEELQKMNRAHEAEVLKLNAMIKRKELHITSLEETVSQKTKANEELTAICDELINKVSSR